MLTASVSHVFRPIGQGLFAQGFVRLQPRRTPVVSWIHDCGATGNRVALRREIERAQQHWHDFPVLDVLVLSHLDEDHVNGLSDLLKQVRVRHVVLPYVTPADRLIFAMGRPGRIDTDYVRFLADPAGYLRSLTEVDVVIYIDTPGDNGSPKLFPYDEPVWSDAKQEREEPRIEGDEDHLSEAATAPCDRRFRGQARLICAGIWEFHFYNRRAWRGCIPRLQEDVRKELEVFRASPPAARDYHEFLRRLRRLYRDAGQFGAGADGRNEISLMTYSGPLGYPHCTRRSECCYPADTNHRLSGALPAEQGARAILYTGDVTMDTALRSELRGQLTDMRWKDIAVLQVPHHGADSAWQDSPATEWQHRRSIFSYGLKNTFRHPGARTKTALANYGPTYVNENRGFHSWYVAEWTTPKRPNVKRVCDE